MRYIEVPGYIDEHDRLIGSPLYKVISFAYLNDWSNRKEK
jgi:hypothetical protein